MAGGLRGGFGGGTGGGGGDTGGGVPDGFNPCTRLAFDARLQSAHTDRMRSLSVGQVLTVQLEGKRVVARSAEGVVGNIIENLTQLKSCLEQGYTFKASVLRASEGDVRVRVQAST